MEKTIKMNKIQQQLVRELLEQDLEFLKTVKPEKEDAEALVKCMQAEEDLLKQLGE